MYSAKDIEELNAKNIEYPEGSMHTLYETEQQQRAFERKIMATKRTLAEYYNVKYNDIKRYKLLKHNDDIRNDVSLEDIKDAILNGKIKITHGGDSILHSTEICGVTINPHTGNLIQVNPK